MGIFVTILSQILTLQTFIVLALKFYYCVLVIRRPCTRILLCGFVNGIYDVSRGVVFH